MESKKSQLMEKSQSSTKSSGVCEKIHKTVARNSAFLSIHRISRGSRSPSPGSAAIKTKTQASLKKPVAPGRSHRAAEVNIPILHNHDEFESSSMMLPPQAAPGSNMILIEIHGKGVYVKPKAEPAKPHLSMYEHNGDKKTQVSDGAEKFTNYINYVRNKLRTTSNIAEEKTDYDQSPPTRIPTRRDSFNERVANFINRARNNIRTTSN